MAVVSTASLLLVAGMLSYPNLVGAATPVKAAAAAASLEVALTQTDGTPSFDATDGPGLDSGPSNGIVRTNDTMTYNVEVRAEGATSTNTTFTLPLPRGFQVTGLPPFCIPAHSSLTPATLPAPANPLTATSYLSLPVQTLTCDVGTRGAGSTFTYPVVARVRSEIPDGTSEGPVTASAVSDAVTTPAVSNPKSVTVSSAPKWDVSKNSVAVQPDSGYFFSRPHACAFDASQTCYFYQFAVLLSAPSQGKGSGPLTGPITFSDNLTPDSLYGAGTTAKAAWTAAGAGALAKYGARLVSCANAAQANAPGNKLTSSTTTVNSVRDSGTIACTQSGPGAAVNVTITGADTSLYTSPTTAQTPPNALAGGKAYAISSELTFDVPIVAINDLGTLSGGVKSLQMVNKYENLSVTGLKGEPNLPGADDPSNNFRTINARLSAPGGFDKAFSGVPTAASNTPATQYNTSWPIWEGPPGGHIRHSGSITAAPGQTVLSSLVISGSDLGNPLDGSAIACDSWDNSKLYLAAGNYPSNSLLANRVASGGAAAWVSGAYLPNGRTATTASQLPANTVEYGTGLGGPNGASACGTGTWYADPALVPGNDPTLAAQGIYTAVTRVRIWTALPAATTGSGDKVHVFASIGLQVVPGQVAGTKLPNYAGVRFHFGSIETQAQNLADATNKWSQSTYNPVDNSGSLGDRLIDAPAFARITKLVKGPNDNTFTNQVPAVSGGDVVQYQLAPTLTSSAPVSPIAEPVSVEDCLPTGQAYLSATLTPQVIAQTTPAGAGITCAAGETYIRWDLGPQFPNVTITPIVVTVKVSAVAPSGTYTNTTLVSAQDDESSVAQRTAHAQIQIVQPAGVKIDKTALTPVVEVNRAAETNKAPLKWRVDFANLNAPQAVSNVDVIDTLPAPGVGTTSYNGTLAFTSAAVTAGGANVRILYTSAGNFDDDPAGPTNGATGSTVWCDAPAGGTVVLGTGTAANCPTSAAAVTGLRVQRPGPFISGDVISFIVTETPSANTAGDIYDNEAFGRVSGLLLPVGPVQAPETVVSSSIGDFVWHDANSNGLQDAGETGVANFPVQLSGTDSDGNAVTATTTTDATGHYLFSGLQSGSYTVTFPPSGLGAGQTFTTQTVGTDTAIDSNGDVTTGVSAPETLPVDTVDLTVDQGIIDSAVNNPPPPTTTTASGSVSATTTTTSPSASGSVINNPPPPTSSTSASASEVNNPPSASTTPTSTSTSSTSLPFTGTAALTGGVAALILLGAGGLMLLAGRRRRFR